ncbi:uncharacterized protein PGTG_01212 [Puccinia graminis f. sp. tritici CRL 75-36-700-3]|uniref:Uncharacterized protein n=1 Tax=Puccinia graminis f. sp. tritici (strain CRL 75-36-700-3 / race SCCL) TaxID=418459 RepID=E3JV06_PUCGT|nr:uncharacterized protein PGTG_01212 [Puccinia graminis f. sp. tritici CRL 75-36-700-3]EFP75881.2 hypothetical protein PGTG_01212 [Puccinia graminis f. sp. tritici CRL 75-36-700-3]
MALPWETDGGVNGRPNSIEVLLEWLSAPGNYDRWIQADLKAPLTQEIHREMIRKGIHHQTPHGISLKIYMLHEGYHHACHYRRQTPEDLRRQFPNGYLSFAGYADMICRDWARLENIFVPPDDLAPDATDPDPLARERIMFNTEAASQIVGFVDHIQAQYHETMEQIDGYVPWSTYFLNNQEDRANYPLLHGLDPELILRRYANLTMG